MHLLAWFGLHNKCPGLLRVHQPLTANAVAPVLPDLHAAAEDQPSLPGEVLGVVSRSGEIVGRVSDQHPSLRREDALCFIHLLLVGTDGDPAAGWSLPVRVGATSGLRQGWQGTGGRDVGRLGSARPDCCGG